MKISTKGRYALEAVVDLAIHSEDGLENIKNISERLEISKNYLEQLFVVLRRKGIIDSVRGAQGGYRLATETKNITAGDVLRAVEGSLAPVSCLDYGRCNQPCENYGSCVTRNLWEGILGEINSVVDSVTIEDLLKSYEITKGEYISDYSI